MSDSNSVDIHKNDLTIIRVSNRTYEGHDFIDIRQYFKDDDGEFKPTKKGITFPPGLLVRVVNALNEIEIDSKREL